MDQSQETYQTIENYVLGNTSPAEIDEVWLLFLKDPELFEYFLTELHLRSYSLTVPKSFQ